MKNKQKETRLSYTIVENIKPRYAYEPKIITNFIQWNKID